MKSEDSDRGVLVEQALERARTSGIKLPIDPNLHPLLLNYQNSKFQFEFHLVVETLF